MAFKINVGTRIFGGFALVLGLTLIAFISGILGVNQIGSNIKQVSEVNFPAITSGAAVSQNLLTSQILLVELYNSYSLSDVNKKEQIFNKLKKDSIAYKTQLNELVTDLPQLQSELKKSSGIINNYFESAEALIEQHKTSLNKKAQADELTTEFSDMGDEILSFSYDLEGLTENESTNASISELTTALESTIDNINSALSSANIYEVRSTASIVKANVDDLSTKLKGLTNLEGLSEASEISSIQDAYSRFQPSAIGSNSAIAKHTEYLQLQKTAKELLQDSQDKSKEALKAFIVFTKGITNYTDIIKQQAASSVQTTSGIIISFGLIVLAVSIAISILVTRSITHPLKTAIDKIKKVSTGDLTVSFHTSRTDELGVLNDNMDTLIQGLKKIISEIASSSHTLASTAEETTAISTQSYESVVKQREQTDIINTSLSDMVNSVASVSSSINNTLEAVEDAHDKAISGESLLKENINRIQLLSTSIEEASEVIGLLNQETNNISSVLEVIRGVAEQTNLLALNAAIEAARAGEQGRGFAVVADEVRTLASRSHDSTAEIQELIERLLAGAEKAVKSMGTSRTETHECVSGIESVGQMLSTINHSINSIKDMSQQISHASHEQSNSAKKQSENVNEISALSEITSNSAEENRQASEDLARMAEHQRELISKFKI